MKQLTILILLLTTLLTGCFQPVMQIKARMPTYPVEVFLENQRPERPFDVIQELSLRSELPLDRSQMVNNRMISRGNNQQDKEVLLAKLTVEAKKLGADALMNVRYTYYTTREVNGYEMTGVAVKYKREFEVAN